MEPSKLFNGTLRPYQHLGINWLHFLKEYNLGGILADDMGLGKTVQIIAHLSNYQDSPTLIVCPATLMENWYHEFKKFAPELNVAIEHKSVKKDETANIKITSYQTLLNREDLKKVYWEHLILDEAQLIKNHKTKIATTCRDMKSSFKLCLSGTPIENRTTDLWSLFEFLMPNFLGGYTQFVKIYQTRLKQLIESNLNLEAELIKNQLSEKIAPFILRRKKSDKSIINDLPEKIEKLEVAELGKDQKRLYRKLIQQFESDRAGIIDLFREKQIILTLLTRLKQVCNHPSFIDKNDHRIKNRSGKLNLLEQLLSRIKQINEKTLIFSQYKTTCRLLHKYLSEELGYNVYIIDGEISVSNRKNIIQSFEDSSDPSILILSLKAGGTGLNITSANHVIHYDRWWNPAVEDQATDRSFRIGQEKNVMVHKLITKGTIEEKIDKLIQFKRELSESIITTDENIISQLSTEEILELVEPDFED